MRHWKEVQLGVPQTCGVAPLDTFLQVFLFQQEPCPLQMLLLFYCLCPDSQALGTDSQDHDEDSDQECNQRPEEAVQEDSLIMGALQHHIIWPTKKRNRRGRKYRSTQHHQFVISGKHLPWKRKGVLFATVLKND